LRQRGLDDEAEPEDARIGQGGRPLGLRDLARLEAARADVHALRRAVLDDPDLLEVRVEPPLGGDHRMRAALAERRPLPAGVTDLGHRAGEYRSRGGGYRLCDAPGDTGPHIPAR